MAYRDAFLTVDQLDRERTRDVNDQIRTGLSGMSKGVLDYDSLLKEEEARRDKLKQQIIENSMKDRVETRNDRIETRNDREGQALSQWRDNQFDLQKSQEGRQVQKQGFDQNETTVKNEKTRVKEQIKNTVAAAIAEGHSGAEALKRSLEIMDKDPVANKHATWQDFQAEITRQEQESAEYDDDQAYKTGLLDVKKTAANRPRASRGGSGSNPKLEGLSAKERSTVSEADASLPVLEKLQRDVEEGRADPGPVSSLMNKARKVLGLIRAGDDEAAAEVDMIATQEMNSLFGSAISAGEMKRALAIMPSFSDDNEGFLMMVKIMHSRIKRRRDSAISTAALNIDAKGGDGNRLRSTFGLPLVGTEPQSDGVPVASTPTKAPARAGGAPKSAKAIPPRDPGEKRSAWARRLDAAGFPEDQIRKIVMGG